MMALCVQLLKLCIPQIIYDEPQHHTRRHPNMILSRGLRWSAQNIGIGRRRIGLFSTRSVSFTMQSAQSCANSTKFSSTLNPHGYHKPISLVSKAGAGLLRAPLRPEILRAASQIRNGASLRFQSTSSSVSGSTDSVTTNIDHTRWAQESGNLEPIDKAIDLTSVDLSTIPEQIGYLKAMGLDFGHGPTAMMEWIMEHVHVLAGTPWWASIAITALLVRVVLFYPNILGAENASKIAATQHITKPLMEKMKESSRLGDTAETMKIRAELSMINKRAGVKYSLMLVPFIQAPIGFGTFFLLRAMSKLPVPGLETGGLLWFSNLTIPDPFFILPFATAGMLHLLLRVRSSNNL
jgi:YidC/Oxa1 family membrane protein insertase